MYIQFLEVLSNSVHNVDNNTWNWEIIICFTFENTFFGKNISVVPESTIVWSLLNCMQ